MSKPDQFFFRRLAQSVSISTWTPSFTPRLVANFCGSSPPDRGHCELPSFGVGGPAANRVRRPTRALVPHGNRSAGGAWRVLEILREPACAPVLESSRDSFLSRCMLQLLRMVLSQLQLVKTAVDASIREGDSASTFVPCRSASSRSRSICIGVGEVWIPRAFGGR